ncbi:hypothetical protein PFICI_00942 [Pestalotiopsis fici W106-1]|uniref:CENP-V/GFA domain-containing protein n=1 Tax=Pestalotiopsis fici (strain W106-1 / CGMCC3.15140) TaxID=1229662 RepID=W3XM94_PESFW|nr:uncharacterized protein PFICI_00942 [Pestalotiopsis fici W106-1]ETS87114.1 hypothetical protein PFICI_00942 [Pestalotiopsis fici W106-1]
MSTSTVTETETPQPKPGDSIVWRFNDDPMPKVPQTGGCRCGTVRFHIQHEVLTKQPGFHIPVKMCNCSICGRNGYLMIFPERDEIEWISGKDTLSEYRFATEKNAHKFCGRCGSSVLMDPEGTWKSWAGDVVGLNVRMLDDWDFEDLHLHKKNRKDCDPSKYATQIKAE